MTAFIPREADTAPDDPLNRLFDRWDSLIHLVRETPLFPVNHIADMFEKAVELIGPSDRLHSLIANVDLLVAERAGKGATADRARRRAWSHVNAGRYVAAIDEFHNTKINWFVGETIEGSILAMLALSDCYEQLHLHMAARYYAAGALYAALSVENEGITHLIGQAAFRVSDTFYVAGEWITYVFSLSRALDVRRVTTRNPHDWTKHSYVQSAFAHATILRAISLRIAPSMIPLIDEAMSTWPLPASEQQLFREMSEEAPWSIMPLEEIEEKIAIELAQPPFSDVGSERSITWQAFGIVWTITCIAERNTWLAALEVAVAIQIVQVNLQIQIF